MCTIYRRGKAKVPKEAFNKEVPTNISMSSLQRRSLGVSSSIKTKSESSAATDEVVVCSGLANSFLPFRHGELITIFGAVVKPTLDELSALWLSCSWIYNALAVRQGDSSFFCSDFTQIGLSFKYINKVSDEVCKPYDVLTLAQRADHFKLQLIGFNGLAHIQWVKEVKSIVFISSQAKEATSSMEEAQLVVGFCTKSFSKEAQVSLKRIATLAIRVRSLIDPTAKILAPMIG
ncbi:hypothetical protein Tco_0854131 [Tanacetum coccineum]